MQQQKTWTGPCARDPRVGDPSGWDPRVGTRVFGCRGPEHGKRVSARMGSRVGEPRFENHDWMDASQVMLVPGFRSEPDLKTSPTGTIIL